MLFFCSKFKEKKKCGLSTEISGRAGVEAWPHWPRQAASRGLCPVVSSTSFMPLASSCNHRVKQRWASIREQRGRGRKSCHQDGHVRASHLVGPCVVIHFFPETFSRWKLTPVWCFWFETFCLWSLCLLSRLSEGSGYRPAVERVPSMCEVRGSIPSPSI